MFLSHITDSFTRPDNTTAYEANDLVANHVTAGSVVPLTFAVPTGNGRGVLVREWHIIKSGTTITNADFDLVLFDGATAPTSTAGDNAAFFASNVYACDKGANFIGVLEGAQMFGFSDVGSQVYHKNQSNTIIDVIDKSLIHGFLVAQAAYEPEAEEVFTVHLALEHYNV